MLDNPNLSLPGNIPRHKCCSIKTYVLYQGIKCFAMHATILRPYSSYPACPGISMVHTYPLMIATEFENRYFLTLLDQDLVYTTKKRVQIVMAGQFYSLVVSVATSLRAVWLNTKGEAGSKFQKTSFLCSCIWKFDIWKFGNCSGFATVQLHTRGVVSQIWLEIKAW